MATKWFHKCDLDWLKARQQCLTATDVKDLLPVTKTGRKRNIDDDSYLKVLSRKLVNLTDDDCLSNGAAARGHILEPFAIDRYNNEGIGVWLNHFDDVVITKRNHIYGGLAFSPDACNTAMDYEVRRLNKRIFEDDGLISCIGEIKSYSAERHLACAYTPKEELDERWQIATAMAVCDNIDTAYLLLYNPSMEQQLYVVDYDRSDLADEIATIEQVEQDWLAWLDTFKMLDHAHCLTGNPNAEQAIVDEIMRREELNPEGERSVVR